MGIVSAFRNWIDRIKLRKKIKKYDANKLNGHLADTNILLRNPEILNEYNDIVIPSHVLREIEHLELTRQSDKLLQYQIRKFKRLSKDFDNYVDLKDYKFNLRDDWDKSYTDNILVQICLERNLGMITNDSLLRKKSRLYGIVVADINVSEFVENKGFQEESLSESQLYHIMSTPNINSFELMVNEYIIINNVVDGELLDIIKWTGKELKSLRDEKTGKLGTPLKTVQFQELIPRDEQQIMAIDSILNNQLTSLRGRAGSGKSLIALNTAWHLVEKEGYKLVMFVNATPLKDSQEMGFYKGSRIEKLMQSAVGTMLKSKFGDEQEILNKIAEGTLDILPFVDLRGYDTSDQKTIVWVLEAQNLTSELLKLGLQRIAENTKVVVDGDYEAQVDKDVYASDNGMKRMSEIFRGNELYGEIELQNVWRSKLASLAEEM